jgi:pSer/pThr/pTyr-binding forkhead associated (FHA) protein
MANPSVYLKALTPEARTAIGGQYHKITHFPFKVGRESRTVARSADVQDPRRRPDSIHTNDLYIHEPGTILNVSRKHFLIDYRDGVHVIVDLDSSCGTLLEGEPVGERNKGGWRRLENNDVIIVGTSESRFIFKFVIMQDP